MKGKRNGLRILLSQRPLGQERELKTQRQRFSNSKTIWPMLNSRDWSPQSPKRLLSRWYLLSERVWMILQVPTMGRIGKIRMKCQSRASWAKMMNRAGWWAQSPKRYSSACRSFGRCRWSMTNWHNRDGRMQPRTSVHEKRSTAQPNFGFR